ncbi:hypothetical protein [Alkaliphilus serpentinus]|uniref:DUF1643 domain-containing protein n=1 Tax=Alkaliphilus serpentinus TaxID=1482731 RepID=A0A833HLG0_9FIRM|nr:hypothetical protein [Alkaliphilus serpentinus]KAB3525750.1 hypothetical protein F8153_14705 [Alkaliphilus serpentinus]
MSSKLSRRVLNEKFDCYGHFYRIMVNDSKLECCRSVLEIVTKTTKFMDLADLSIRKPDLLVIMMNPGSSKPEELNYHGEEIKADSFKMDFKKKVLVKAEPDDTQYFIQQIMLERKFKHSRILNLSDIRLVNSNQLNKRIRNFEKYTKNKVHSIFSLERRNELQFALNINKRTPVILAWGRNDFRKKYAKMALEQVHSFNCFGINTTNKKELYYHPSRHKDWVLKILEQLENIE